MRTEGGKNLKYLERFGSDFHKGMLWIKNIPNYEYVYIHIGNKPKDTLGCPLTVLIADSTKESISSSTSAYKLIYPIISEAIIKGDEVLIEIKDFE